MRFANIQYAAPVAQFATQRHTVKKLSPRRLRFTPRVVNSLPNLTKIRTNLTVLSGVERKSQTFWQKLTLARFLYRNVG